MSTIRKQSIISSGVVYVGLGLGVLTNYLLAREFTPDQYGLISGMFVAIGTVMSYLGGLGTISFIAKFYPYYHDNLEIKKNDLFSWAFVALVCGFVLTVALGIVFRNDVVRFYQEQSPALVRYYYWIFPFGFGMGLFGILEVYAWQVNRSVRTNIFREILLRLVTLALIALYLTGVLGNFTNFVKSYSLVYIFISALLLWQLRRSKDLHFAFYKSRVTRKFFRKIVSVAFLGWGGGVLFNLAFYFAQIVIAGLVTGGLKAVGIFQLAILCGSLIQAPQKGIITASMAPLARAWKDKDHEKISRIYKRSSINMLSFSIAMFFLIWMNYQDGIHVFRLNEAFLLGQTAFLFIGLARIVDLGTGISSQIIYTSVYYRFEIYSGICLVCFTIPLNYLMAKAFGITGPAIADLVTLTCYNGFRAWFLYRKHGLQPFSRKSLYAILLGLAAWGICALLFGKFHGFGWMVFRSCVFLAIYGTGTLALRISEDIVPVWHTIRKRMSRLTGAR